MTAADLPVEPTRTAVSLVVLNDRDEFLVVLRPDDPEDDLANVWGLPAISTRPGEDLEAAAHRVGQAKLGVEVEVGRMIGECTHDRGWGVLRLVDFEARVVSGTPSVPQSNFAITQYAECRFTDDPTVLFAAARMGSQCTQVFLEDRGIEWRAAPV